MSRFYPVQIGDKVITFPSVTTQITTLNHKGLLGDSVWWFKASEDSCAVGTEAHEWIDWINKGNKFAGDYEGQWWEFSEDTRNSLRAYIRFRDKKHGFGFIPLESEFLIYSLDPMYAGRVDCRGLHKNQVYLVDWTTGMKPVEYWKMQLALYLKGYIFLHPRRRVAGVIKVNLNKITGNYSLEIMYPDEAEQVYQEYLKLRKEAGIR